MKAAGTFAQAGSTGAVSSDVARGRRLVRLLVGAAVVALVAALIALGTPGAKLAASAAPGPLSRDHLAAGLTCASCHGAQNARASCTGCHAAEAHRSSRAPHRALSAAASPAGGSLGCVDCHAGHDAAGVQLDGDRATVWQGARAWTVSLAAPAPRARLPLVPRAACARCHDVASPRDPVARCLAPGAVYSGCFDEHAAGSSALPYAVIDAVRRAADAVPALSRLSSAPSTPSTTASLPPAALLTNPDVDVALAALVAGLALSIWPASRRRERPRSPAPVGLLGSAASLAPVALAGAEVAQPAPAAVRRLPLIDASRCLGCRACVDACAFDVLEVDRFVAQVVRPDACCGAITCELACPNGSLTLVPVDATDATADASGGPRAHLDGALESPDAPMVFLAGDLTGVPLIKHAIRQGRLVADRIAAKLPRSKPSDLGDLSRVHDVVIVGAGPAGLSATLRARELGLSVVTLEQGQVGASIRAFPRGKLVFERPLTLPLEGELWMEECTKEELLAQWERIVRVHRLPVRPGHRVRAIERLAASYRLTVSRGDDPQPVHVSARALVLALGTRGTPRPLPAPIDPAVEGRIAYALVDAASFADRRVLVVGLGDSAMEAALGLARQPGCHVTILARGEAFTRGSARTLRELQEAVSTGRITLHFAATVTAVTAAVPGATAAAEARVKLGSVPEPVAMPFDQMFVFIGGTGPWALLRQAGVVVRGVS